MAKEAVRDPPLCTDCSKPLPGEYYLCKTCQKNFCTDCINQHLANTHQNRPLLTPMGCAVCGQQIAGTCNTDRCLAPLCNSWGCREQHENNSHGLKYGGTSGSPRPLKPPRPKLSVPFPLEEHESEAEPDEMPYFEELPSLLN